MSRIGNAAINIPPAVTVEMTGSSLVVKGPLGVLSITIQPEVKVERVEQQLIVKRLGEEKRAKSIHGLTRSLIANMVTGVEKGWEKNLELVGVGYRSQTTGDKLTLAVGFSHTVEIEAPVGIKFAVLDNTKITVTGFDKELVGHTAAKIRSVKPPEPYQGKGIRYSGEYVRRKAGKAGKVGAAGGK
ncbi:MAG: 50S ribosomal protein L6 [Candidatus Daviesbacteria bacterium]|nr:50S ribosomal protein L6 [Candidatus Daviesbacteria bacterium]